MDSVFTTEVREEGRVFAENELAFAFPTNIPITPGHSLVVPRRVVKSMNELTPEEVVSLFALVDKVKASLARVLGAEGFNCAWNEGGKEYGQSVPHLHIHIVPRTPGDAGITTYEPRDFLYRPGSREISPSEELNDIAQLLRSDMQNNA